MRFILQLRLWVKPDLANCTQGSNTLPTRFRSAERLVRDALRRIDYGATLDARVHHPDVQPKTKGRDSGIRFFCASLCLLHGRAHVGAHAGRLEKHLSDHADLFDVWSH